LPLLFPHLRASVRADVQEIFRRAGTTAVLVAQLQDEAGVEGSEPVVVRIIGGSHHPAGPQVSVGAMVTLRARGPVFAWPAD